jgi:hypothetical protein
MSFTALLCNRICEITDIPYRDQPAIAAVPEASAVVTFRAGMREMIKHCAIRNYLRWNLAQRPLFVPIKQDLTQNEMTVTRWVDGQFIDMIKQVMCQGDFQNAKGVISKYRKRFALYSFEQRLFS